MFVNLTAAWCITCLLNEEIALATPATKSVFENTGTAYLKGDWTNRDPAITAELAKWNRSAVPFNLIYAPGAAEPTVLPELLTPGIVVEALAKVGAK